MSYNLRSSETFGHGLRRICRREIERAIKSTHRPHDDEKSPVHQTRKQLKKTRAALRLMAPAVPAKEFESTDRELKKAARLLSQLRDAEVRFRTVRQLIETFNLETDRMLDETKNFLGLELESFFAASGDWQSEVQERLSRVGRRISHTNAEKLNCKQVRCVVQQTYRHGVRVLRKAIDAPTAENFHTFRKAAKELMYQLRILRPAHPPFFQPLVDELKILSEHLGHAHDLAFLAERLRSLEPDQSATAGAFFELIELREKELQLKAARLGEKFYAERAKNFGRRLSGHLIAWEAVRDIAISSPHAMPRMALAMNGREDEN